MFSFFNYLGIDLINLYMIVIMKKYVQQKDKEIIKLYIIFNLNYILLIKIIKILNNNYI